MHKICEEIFSGFCRKTVWISEALRTTFFSNFVIFRSQAESDNGCEGGDVAEDAGGKEVEW